MRLIEIRKVRIAAYRTSKLDQTRCVLGQIWDVVAKLDAFDIMHICPDCFQFAAQFNNALNDWRRIDELIQIAAGQLNFELDEWSKHRLIISHNEGSSGNQPEERLCLMQVGDIGKNFEADLVVVEAHLAWNLIRNSAKQNLLFVFEFFVSLPDHTFSQIFTFADIWVVKLFDGLLFLLTRLEVTLAENEWVRYAMSYIARILRVVIDVFVLFTSFD